MADPESTDGAGAARHNPVLLAEVLEALAIRDGGTYCDATFGAGGYSRAILAAGSCTVLALDRDPTVGDGARALAAAADGRLLFAQSRFSEVEAAAEGQGVAGLDGIVFDIGVSSMQLDTAERGFSFRHDGPLDMRMEQTGRSAADILNEAPEEEIANILYRFGEERQSRRIARAIVHDREIEPFTRTRPLAELIGRIVSHKPTEIHPATRTFQALRIAVNDELGELQRGLEAAERVLKPGGRLAVVTFHSLEDRIVKQFLAARSGRGRAASRLLPGEPVPPEPTFILTERHAIMASAAETSRNPRARSAKLRVAERNAVAAPSRAVAASRDRA